MKIAINHLTRMQTGFVCVAGMDPKNGDHIRPILPGRRLPRSLIRHEGGVFDIGALVDLGATKPCGSAPENEDYSFTSGNARLLRTLTESEFWSLLTSCAQAKLEKIFGPDLEEQGKGAAVTVGQGSSSLGVLTPDQPPRIHVNPWDKIRMLLDDDNRTLDLSVTDLRLYEPDQSTPRYAEVKRIEARLNKGEEVLVGLGLTRAWTKPGDDVARHWLQVNNIYLSGDPCAPASW